MKRQFCVRRFDDCLNKGTNKVMFRARRVHKFCRRCHKAIKGFGRKIN